MNVLVIGANGFVGSNLVVVLEELGHTVVKFTRKNAIDELATVLQGIDFVFHLAGVNRPKGDQTFVDGNTTLTQEVCDSIKSSGRSIPLVYTSSIQAERDNPYGVSKRDAEDAVIALNKETGSPVFIFRLPNVFGKWCRPNYNSVVATFCYNIANNLPIQINDPSAEVCLVHIDDVVKAFAQCMMGEVVSKEHFVEVDATHTISLQQLADTLNTFKVSRESLITESVGEGFTRLLYSTYLSYLSPEQFSYQVPSYGDERGVFVEMLKTQDSGQFSFFTAHPGITRGGHYHHCKTEKFLVIKGKARFGFRHIVTGETYELVTEGGSAEIVETVPGWSHDITNIGDDEMVVMLWANEIFDRDNPDTFAHPVL